MLMTGLANSGTQWHCVAAADFLKWLFAGCCLEMGGWWLCEISLLR